MQFLPTSTTQWPVRGVNMGAKSIQTQFGDDCDLLIRTHLVVALASISSCDLQKNILHNTV